MYTIFFNSIFVSFLQMAVKWLLIGVIHKFPCDGINKVLSYLIVCAEKHC